MYFELIPRWNQLCERLPLESSVADRRSSGSKGWKRRLRCPRCGSSLRNPGLHPSCSDTTCAYSESGFPLFDTQPVLIDFEASIFDREMYCSGDGSALRRDVTGRSLGSRLHQLILGRQCCRSLKLYKIHRAAEASCAAACRSCDWRRHRRPWCRRTLPLTIRSSWSAPTSTPRRTPHLVTDAHKLPFEDGVFDGVWVQAVLEHVLEPATIVDEIYRVLRRGGLVYAETPFMQQVHERAYDFSRFTQSGHRWLFKRFSEINAGPIGGCGRGAGLVDPIFLPCSRRGRQIVTAD